MSPKTDNNIELDVPPATPQASNRSRDLESSRERALPTISIPTLKTPQNPLPLSQSPSPHSTTLIFDDFVDLQSRLVLLPYNDSDCTGAVIASYEAGKKSRNAANELPNERRLAEQQQQEKEIISSAEGTRSVSDNSENDTDFVLGGDADSAKIVGSILIAIPGEKNLNSQNVEWRCEEFSTIFSAIRFSPNPIVLKFETIPFENSILSSNALKRRDSTSQFCRNNEDYTDQDSDCSSEYSSGDSVIPEENNTGVLNGKLQLWGLQIQKRNIFADRAISHPRSALNIRKENVQERQFSDIQHYTNKERRHSISSSGTKISGSMIATSRPHENMCSLYLQTSNGKCIPLTDSYYCDRASDSLSSVSSVTSHSSGNSKDGISLFRRSPPTISNTSVLVIRSSAHDSFPRGGFKYQWYRSWEAIDSSGPCDSSANNNLYWIELPEATHYVFQPSASDIGHRVKCIVTINAQPETNSSEEYVSISLACELPRRIEADKTLYDVALKSFEADNNSHIAIMRNITGCGVSEGSQFAIVIITTKDERNDMFKDSFLKISEIFEDNKTELLHTCDIQISEVMAVAHPSKPRHFSLYFSSNMLSNINKIAEGVELTEQNGQQRKSTMSKLAAFCSKNRIDLESPSRLARESTLLVFGIASFRGSLSTMDNKTISLPTLDLESINNDTEFHLKSSTTSSSGDKNSVINDEESSPVSIIQTSAPKSPFNSSQMIEIESALENDLVLLQQKLDDKNRKVVEVTDRLDRSQKESENFKAEYRKCCKSLRLAEKKIESLQSEILNMKDDFASLSRSHEFDLNKYTEAAVDQGKKLRALMNENSILSAEKIARDSKLTKMAQLQKDVEALNIKVKGGEVLYSELNKMNKKYEINQKEIIALQESEIQREQELNFIRGNLDQLTRNLEEEKLKSGKLKKEVDDSKLKYQQLKAEKSIYKQKSESLAKEMTKICRNGMGIDDIEKLIHNHHLVVTEVNLLKSQKKKALEELKEYRTAYEDAKQVQKQAGIDGETLRALGQRAELERLLTELTEILHAKEMQIETMRHVNKSLSEEIHSLTTT